MAPPHLCRDSHVWGDKKGMNKLRITTQIKGHWGVVSRPDGLGPHSFRSRFAFLKHKKWSKKWTNKYESRPKWGGSEMRAPKATHHCATWGGLSPPSFSSWFAFLHSFIGFKNVNQELHEGAGRLRSWHNTSIPLYLIRDSQFVLSFFGFKHANHEQESGGGKMPVPIATRRYTFI